MSYFISRRCPFCDNVTTMEVNDETMKAFQSYQKGTGYIQDIPVNDRPTQKARNIVREFLKTGYCTKCQELLFGSEDDE